MPFFDENPLDKLATQADTVDTELDLRGLGHDAAMARVEEWLVDNAANPDNWLIRFDAADNDGRETLFLPLGRRLLEARRAGQLARCLPASDGAGYHVSFTIDGRP